MLYVLIKTILRVSLNISGSYKYVVARTMQIFNDLAIVHTSRHILLNILFVIHNAVGLEKVTRMMYTLLLFI